MSEAIDYSDIRNQEVRGVIYELLFDMFDNPDENDIYPTSKFMWEMETYILSRQPDKEVYAYASNLFKVLAPQCEPLPDLLGILTQIDNWCAGNRQQNK